jgi:hypothetical protein
MIHALHSPEEIATEQPMLLRHPGRPGCGYTAVFKKYIPLYRLGILPVRCKSCGELITGKEGV